MPSQSLPAWNKADGPHTSQAVRAISPPQSLCLASSAFGEGVAISPKSLYRKFNIHGFFMIPKLALVFYFILFLDPMSAIAIGQ